MKLVQDLIKKLGKPNSVELLDIGDGDERVALIYESPLPAYVWKDKPTHKTATKLTERERQVLHYIAQGHNQKEIAETLSYSVRTIKFDCQNIIRKMKAKNMKHAVYLAFQKKKRESIEFRQD